MTTLQLPLRGFALLAILLLGSFTHAAGHNCSDCHSSGTPTASDLKKSLSALCADCHQARIAAGEHQVDIPAILAGGITLPLQEGNITCITCHDPHGSALALRMTDPELCNQCHKR